MNKEARALLRSNERRVLHEELTWVSQRIYREARIYLFALFTLSSSLALILG